MLTAYIATFIVLMLVNPRRVEGEVVLTNSPSRTEAFAGETVRFNWNYTVDDKNMDFGYYVSSPVWYYYNPDGHTKSVIAVDDGLRGWKWTISRRTCPPRLLYPTVRVSKESVATLVISNVTKNDSGWYGISLVLRISPSITNKVELIVTDKMARFTKVPSSTLFVSRGKAARFEWKFTYDNRNIRLLSESPVWSYVDQNKQWVTIATVKKDPSSSAVIKTTTCPTRLLNPTRVRIEQPATLIISNVTEADNGIYGCMLKLRRELSINSTSTLVVTDHPKVLLSALATKIIQEGSSLNITCSANASPVPHVTWMKISPQKRLAVSETVGLSFLKFMEIERNEGGTYECQATNNPIEPPVTSKINIFVIYFEHSSTLLDTNGGAQIVEGEDLNITCAISPLWLENVTWVHVSTHESLKLGSVEVNSGTLAIRNISRRQQGKYQCQAYDKRDDKPEIDEILSSKHNVSWSRDTIYLRCVVKGVPVPNVTWYGLNGKIRVNGTSYYPGTSTLRLLKLNTLDFGIYSCLAKNRYGIAWHNVTVTKYCPCKLTEQKKKKREKKNNNPAKFFGSTASIVLLPLSAVSFLINVFLLLLLCKSKRFPQTKRPNKTSNAVEFFYNNDSTDAGQIIFGNINSEPPTAVQSESMTNTDEAAQGHYAELTSNSVKMSSLQNYEHLDPTCREQHRTKGFQTFGTHQQSSYEQLHLGTSLPVYQRLHVKYEDIKN